MFQKIRKFTTYYFVCLIPIFCVLFGAVIRPPMRDMAMGNPVHIYGTSPPTPSPTAISNSPFKNPPAARSATTIRPAKAALTSSAQQKVLSDSAVLSAVSKVRKKTYLESLHENVSRKFYSSNSYDQQMFKMGQIEQYQIMGNAISMMIITNIVCIFLSVGWTVLCVKNGLDVKTTPDPLYSVLTQERKRVNKKIVTGMIIISALLLICFAYGFYAVASHRLFAKQTNYYIQMADPHLATITKNTLNLTFATAIILSFAVASTLIRPYGVEPLPRQLGDQFRRCTYCLYAATAVLTSEMLTLSQVTKYCSYCLMQRSSSALEPTFIASDLTNYAIAFSLVTAGAYLPCAALFSKWGWRLVNNHPKEKNKPRERKEEWLHSHGLSSSYGQIVSRAVTIFGPILATILPQLIHLFLGGQ